MRSRLILKILIGIVVVIAVAMGGLWYLVKSIDVETYRSLAQDSVEKATGRKLKLDGDLQVSILSFNPTISVEKASLSNADWGSRPDMASIGRIEVEIALLPLLSSEVQLTRLSLIDADILLEEDAQGRANWDFSKGEQQGEAQPPAELQEAEPAKKAAGDSMRLFVGDLEIKNAIVTYKTPDGSQSLRLDRVALSADGPDDPVNLALKGAFDDKNFDITGVVGAPNALLSGNASTSYPVKLSGEAMGVTLSVEGAVTDPMGKRTLAFQVKADAADLAKTGKAAGAELPDLGALSIQGAVGGSADRPSLSNLAAKLGGAGKIEASVTGSIADLIGQSGADLAVAFAAPNLATIGSSFGAALPAAGPVKLSAAVSDVKGGWKISGLNAAIGKSDASGEATILLDGPRPAVTARLASNLIDLGELKGGDGKSGGGAAASSGKGASSGAASTKVIPNVPLPIDALKMADLSLNWTIKEVADGKPLLQNVALPVTLKAGKLEASPTIGQVAGGSLKGAATLDGSKSPAGIALKLDGAKISAGELLTRMGALNSFTGGVSSLDVNLTGAGDSTGAILSTLSGHVGLVVGEGNIRGMRIDLAAVDAISKVWPFAKSKDADLNCVVTEFTLRNGVANADTLLLDTRNLSVAGQGTVTLPTERLALTLAPSVRNTAVINIDVGIALDVGGTFANPTVAPNPKAVVKDVLGVVGQRIGSSRSGSSSLGSMLGAVVGGGGGSSSAANPCAQALGQPAAPAQSPSQPAKQEKPADQVRGLLRGVLGQ